MSRIHAVILMISLPFLPAACASARGPDNELGNRDRNLITEGEIRAAGATDAYSIVASLRPQWLQLRGPSTITLRESVKVYLDGSLLGGPEYLRQIDAQTISTIQYLDALQATQRWGLDHGNGAIIVSSRQSALRP